MLKILKSLLSSTWILWNYWGKELEKSHKESRNWAIMQPRKEIQLYWATARGTKAAWVQPKPLSVAAPHPTHAAQSRSGHWVPKEQGNRRILFKSNRRCPGPKTWANALLGRQAEPQILEEEEEETKHKQHTQSGQNWQAETQGQDHRTKSSVQGRQLWSQAYLDCLFTLPCENLFHLSSSGSSLLPYSLSYSRIAISSSLLNH